MSTLSPTGSPSSTTTSLSTTSASTHPTSRAPSPTPSQNGNNTTTVLLGASELEIELLTLKISDKVAALKKGEGTGGGEGMDEGGNGDLEGLDVPPVGGWTLREEVTGVDGKKRFLVAVGQERELILNIELDEPTPPGSKSASSN